MKWVKQRKFKCQLVHPDTPETGFVVEFRFRSDGGSYYLSVCASQLHRAWVKREWKDYLQELLPNLPMTEKQFDSFFEANMKKLNGEELQFSC